MKTYGLTDTQTGPPTGWFNIWINCITEHWLNTLLISQQWTRNLYILSFSENFLMHNSIHFTSFTTSIDSCSNRTSLKTMAILKLMKQGDWGGEHHPSHVKCNSFWLGRLIVGIMPWVKHTETAKIKTPQISQRRNHCVILLLPTHHHCGLWF